MAAAPASDDVDGDGGEAAAAHSGPGQGRRKRRVLEADDGDDGSERAAAVSPAAVSPSSPRPRRYHLRPSSVSSAPSGRLQAVDAVLQRLRRQREGQGQRDWLSAAAASGAAEHDAAEREPLSAGSDDTGGSALSPPPARRQSERGGGSSGGQRGRRREEGEDSGAEEAGAADDADWIVAEDDELEGDDAAISRMRLRHEQEMDEDEDEAGGAAPTALAPSTASASFARAAPSLSSALFSSRSGRLPLSAEDGFRYWSLYLTAALVDGQVSAWLQSVGSTRRVVSSAVKAVEESFGYQRTAWVKSSVWEQQSRRAFLSQLDSLPYASSARLTAGDAAVDRETGLPLSPLSASCAACGQHRPSHRLRLYGIAYQPEQLQHPFDTARIFPGQRQRSGRR